MEQLNLRGSIVSPNRRKCLKKCDEEVDERERPSSIYIPTENDGLPNGERAAKQVLQTEAETDLYTDYGWMIHASGLTAKNRG
jgi:hypothetical protein